MVQVSCLCGNKTIFRFRRILIYHQVLAHVVFSSRCTVIDCRVLSKADEDCINTCKVSEVKIVFKVPVLKYHGSKYRYTKLRCSKYHRSKYCCSRYQGQNSATLEISTATWQII